MEHKKANPTILKQLSLDMHPGVYLTEAMKFVLANYGDDYNRIATTNFDTLTLGRFWHEYMWAVYVSGFRASVVSRKWGDLLEAYFPLYIVGDPNTKEEIAVIRANALKVFANERKVDAVIETAEFLRSSLEKVGWEAFKNTRLDTPELLQQLPFIGKITCFHLARNIGLLDFVKPDVHLVRMTKHWGYTSPQVMCEDLGEKFDLKPGLVDLVLWYVASTFGTR